MISSGDAAADTIHDLVWRCSADKGYLSGAAASLDRAARAPTLAALTTTNGSPHICRRQPHLVAGEFEHDRARLTQGCEIKRVPIDRDLAHADAEEPAEVDDGGVDLAVPADDDVYNPSHVLAGVAANTLAQNGRDLLIVEHHRRRATMGIKKRVADEGAAVPGSELSCPSCTAGIEGSAVCEGWLASAHPRTDRADWSAWAIAE